MAHLTELATLASTFDSGAYLAIGVAAPARPVVMGPGLVVDNYAQPDMVSSHDTVFARDISQTPVEAMQLAPYPLSPLTVRTYRDQDLEIRGTVLDELSNPIERDVLIIQRDGYFLGRTRSAPDGTFSLICRDYGAQRVVVIAVPVEADLRNAVVKWGVVPVARL